MSEQIQIEFLRELRKLLDRYPDFELYLDREYTDGIEYLGKGIRDKLREDYLYRQCSVCNGQTEECQDICKECKTGCIVCGKKAKNVCCYCKQRLCCIDPIIPTTYLTGRHAQIIDELPADSCLLKHYATSTCWEKYNEVHNYRVDGIDYYRKIIKEMRNSK